MTFVFQCFDDNRSVKGALLICSKICLESSKNRIKMSILFLMPPMSQTSDLERSGRNCHFKSDNYILIPRMPMPED